jgi:hypothetical protein
LAATRFVEEAQMATVPQEEHPAEACFLLSHAGAAAWSGYYTQAGANGAAFCKLGSAQYRVYRDPGGRWVCTVGGEYAYFHSKAGQDRPPASGWECQRALPPAPKLQWLQKAAKAGSETTGASNAETRRKERELRKYHEAQAKEAQSKVAKATQSPVCDPVTVAQARWMPVVKEGEQLEQAGEAAAALAKYQEAMAGFLEAGVQRPKLQAKIASVQRTLGSGAAAE